MELEFLGSSGKFPGAEENLKRQSSFLVRNSPNGNSRSFSLQLSLIPVSLRPSRLLFGKWKRFVQMVDAITERNLPVLNFVYHIPKP